MQANTINTHLQSETPPQAYIDLGDHDSLTLQQCWDKEEGLIKQVLCSMLPDMAFMKIKGVANIKATWNILKRVYEERSKALVADIIQRFRNKHCEENKSIHSHFKALADLREQLAVMGKAVNDTDYTDTLLASLPMLYDSAVSSISASACLGSKTLTAEIFEQFIIDEYECQKVKVKRNKTKDETLSANSKNKSKGKDKRQVECYNCHKKGHYKSECWAKGGGNEGNGPKWSKGSKDKATLAEEKKEPEAWATVEEMERPANEVTAAREVPALVGQLHTSTCKLYNSGALHHMSSFCGLLSSHPTMGNHYHRQKGVLCSWHRGS